MYPILELVLEMNERGINFLPVDIYKSDATKFLLEGKNLRPPLSALAGFGVINAQNVAKARADDNEPFSSKENLMLRAKLGKSAMEILENNGCLKGMANSSQIDLFEM